MHRPNK